jgi:hypothetical protein
MKVFLSWSGEPSKSIASGLKDWLSDVFHDLSVWMSDHDIDAGSRWAGELDSQLETTDFGILCLTPTNCGAPWLLYEAGALAKVVKSARVVPYRWHIKATDLTGPLAQFQGVDADEDGTRRLLRSINQARPNPLDEPRLLRLFEKWWPDLSLALEDMPTLGASPLPQRPDRTLLEETLELVRGISSAQRKQPEPPPSSIWVPARPTKTVHEVTVEEIAAMNDSELTRYQRALRGRWLETLGSGEEQVLELKLNQVTVERSRRRDRSAILSSVDNGHDAGGNPANDEDA